MSIGRVFDIQRFCVHDGPGIRTTVFLKGCPLKCRWCHNPEGISVAPVLSFMAARCIGCGACVRACPNGAHVIEGSEHKLLRGQCAACGRCAAECPTSALELVGREMTVDEVMKVVISDEAFYRTSGGGMTLSGGEPTLQMDFCIALCEAAKKSGIHCCIETCGFGERLDLKRLAGVVDLFLFDVKETDPARHMEYTGVSNETILRNLRTLHGLGAGIVLRLPLVPGLNDRPEHSAAVEQLAASLPGLRGVERIPYHPMGLSKLARFGSTIKPQDSIDTCA
jgi:glycyl-radical enzyme activating protein